MKWVVLNTLDLLKTIAKQLRWSKRDLRYFIIPTVMMIAFIWGMLTSALILSKMTLIEFIISMAPQEYMTGVNILAFGTDETSTTQRSDTIMILHMDHQKKRIGVLSIPRDTRVNIPGHGLTRVNHAYAYGGAKLLKQTVSEFLNIPIDYYIKIKLNNVETFIDKLGGVNINIEKELHYVDQAGDLYIDLKEGRHVLDGAKAIEFLRFRQDSEGDIGRIRRQQTFLDSLAKQLFSVKMLVKLPTLLTEMTETIETNLTAKQIVGLAKQFSEVFKLKNIEKATVPGAITMHKGMYFWRPDIPALDRLIQRVIFNFESTGGQVATVKTIDRSSSQDNRRRVTIKEVQRLSKQTDIANTEVDELDVILRVEVLNGYGKAGEASKLVNYLKKLDIKVPAFGNAGSFDYKRTQLVDWKGNVGYSVALAKALSIDPSQIIVYDRPEKTIDATIVLGEDWERIQKKIDFRRTDRIDRTSIGADRTASR